MEANQAQMFISQNSLLNVTSKNSFVEAKKFLSAATQPWLQMFFSTVHKVHLSSPVLGQLCLAGADGQ